MFSGMFTNCRLQFWCKTKNVFPFGILITRRLSSIIRNNVYACSLTKQKHIDMWDNGTKSSLAFCEKNA